MSKPGAMLPTMDEDQLAGTWQRVEAGEHGRVTSLGVARHANAGWGPYAEGVDAEPRHNTRSATKTVTGMLVGVAVDLGHLRIEDPVAGFFPELAPLAHPDARKE